MPMLARWRTPLRCPTLVCMARTETYPRTPDVEVLPAETKSLERIRLVARVLDDLFRIPGTNYRIGLDGVLGVVPGFGDALGSLLSGYIIWEGLRLGVSARAVVRMIGNLFADAAIGVFPVLGDLLDFTWKANRRNLIIIEEELARNPHALPRSSSQSAHLLRLLCVLVVVGSVLLSYALLAFIVRFLF